MESLRNTGVFKDILLAPHRSVRAMMMYGNVRWDVTWISQGRTVRKHRDIGNGLVSAWKARRDAIERRVRYLLPIVEDPFAREPHRELLAAIGRSQLGTSFPREPPTLSEIIELMDRGTYEFARISCIFSYLVRLLSLSINCQFANILLASDCELRISNHRKYYIIIFGSNKKI